MVNNIPKTLGFNLAKRCDPCNRPHLVGQDLVVVVVIMQTSLE